MAAVQAALNQAAVEAVDEVQVPVVSTDEVTASAAVGVDASALEVMVPVALHEVVRMETAASVLDETLVAVTEVPDEADSHGVHTIDEAGSNQLPYGGHTCSYGVIMIGGHFKGCS